MDRPAGLMEIEKAKKSNNGNRLTEVNHYCIIYKCKMFLTRLINYYYL